jgi:predicted lipoprotein with Yx(FWY)xxD motif
LLSTKRIIVAAVGVPVLLALTACGGQYGGDGYTGNDTNVSATTTPEATADANDNGANNGLQAGAIVAPVGIATDKLIATTVPKMGKVVTDSKGWILYRFDKDTAKPSASNCSGQCAAVWPPMLTDGNPTVEGMPRENVGTITRDDGATQLTVGGWPVYRYIGDTKPGQWTGQMVAGTWFVIDPNGKKNLTCVPTATPTAVAPPAAGSADQGSGSNSGSGY